jgi:O-glycosyl hydrolase
LVNGNVVPFSSSNYRTNPNGECALVYWWSDVVVDLGQPGAFTIELTADNTVHTGDVACNDWQLWTYGDTPPASFQDSFSDGVIAPWTVASGTWSEHDGVIDGSGPPNTYLWLFGPTEWEISTLTVRLNGQSGIDKGFSICGSTCIGVNLRSSPYNDVWTFNGSTWSGFPYANSQNTWYDVAIQIHDASFDVSVNGTYVGSRTLVGFPTPHQLRTVGLWTYYSRVWFDDVAIWSVQDVDTAGPYPPPTLRFLEGEDTGRSVTDGITYIGSPLFGWSQPPDSGTCGTANAYQFAVTSRGLNPWDGPRLREGFVADSSARPGNVPDGSYTFWVQAKDNCEHWGQWAPLDYQIDTTAPGLPHDLTNPEGPVTADTTPNVYWTCEDDSIGSGIWTYDIRFTGPGGSPSHAYQSGDAVLDDVDYGAVPLETGPWDWSVRAVDVAGNATDWSGPRALTVVAGPRWVHVEPEEKYQVIDGFGGAFAMMGYYPDESALSIVTDGLGATIVRLEGDTWKPASTEWEVCLQTVTHAVQEHGVEKVLLSFWYPPDEFLLPGRLWNPAYDYSWADAMAERVVHVYRDPLVAANPSVTIYLSPQNEPNNKDCWAYWTPAQLRNFLPLLRQRLAYYGGSDVKILVPECSDANVTWDPVWSLENFRTELAEPEGPFVEGFNHHIYDSGLPGLIDEQYAALAGRLNAFRQAIANANERSWQTETSGAHLIPNPQGAPYPTVGYFTGMDEYDKAIAAARYIHLSLTQANSSAFLWWGLTWCKTVPPDLNVADEGLLLVDDSQRPMPPADTTAKYFAFKQFSKYVRPGYRRVFAWSDDPVLASAYVSESGDKLVVVLINPYAAPWPVLLDPLPGYVLLETRRTLTGIATGFQLVEWAGEMPGRSIATLVFGQESSGAGQNPPIPQRLTLSVSVSPNPSRAGAEIDCEVDSAGMISISIFDPSGRRVRDLTRTRLLAGKHKILWDGRDNAGEPVGTAVYFVRLTSGERVKTARLVIVK